MFQSKLQVLTKFDTILLAVELEVFEQTFVVVLEKLTNFWPLNERCEIGCKLSFTVALTLLVLLGNTILKDLSILFLLDCLLLLLQIGCFALISHRLELVVELFLLAAEEFLLFPCLFFLSLCLIFSICL